MPAQRRDCGGLGHGPVMILIYGYSSEGEAIEFAAGSMYVAKERVKNDTKVLGLAVD